MTSRGDRIWIEAPEDGTNELERAVSAISTVFGVTLALPSWVLPASPDAGFGPSEVIGEQVIDAACALAAANLPGRKPAGPAPGFALRVRRRCKRFPIASQELAIRAGRAILDRTPWTRVDLTDPACSIFIEAHEDGVFFWTRRVRGPGGLPVGTAGRLVALLSGGFDSPVAAWMMASRGATLDFVHLTPGRPDPADPASAKAIRLAAALSRYTGGGRLLLVPYTRFDLSLVGRPTGLEAVLFRRFAFRCAAAAADRFGAGALVTGDSLSQVASQTFENLVSADAAAPLPVLRPLIGMDKASILERAQRIGTHDISAAPARDCCALIAGSPRTRSTPARVEQAELRLMPDPDALVTESLEDSRLFRIEGGSVVAAPAGGS